MNSSLSNIRELLDSRTPSLHFDTAGHVSKQHCSTSGNGSVYELVGKSQPHLGDFSRLRWGEFGAPSMERVIAASLEALCLLLAVGNVR